MLNLRKAFSICQVRIIKLIYWLTLLFYSTLSIRNNLSESVEPNQSVNDNDEIDSITSSDMDNFSLSSEMRSPASVRGSKMAEFSQGKVPKLTGTLDAPTPHYVHTKKSNNLYSLNEAPFLGDNAVSNDSVSVSKIKGVEQHSDAEDTFLQMDVSNLGHVFLCLN